MRTKNHLINLTEDKIHHLYPRIISVEIQIKKVSHMMFRSKITLKTKNKNIYAHKEDQSYRKCLARSYAVIKKKLERLKINRIHTDHLELIFEDHVLNAQAA